MDIKKDYSLQKLNTFGLKVKAQYFCEITSLQDLKDLLSSNLYRTERKLILGGGSNILFTQDFQGLLIKMGIKGIRLIDEDKDHVSLEVGAGENWHQFVLYCIDQHYSGIENLSLIPGNVGAAPIQNIGAYGVEQKEVFQQLRVLELTTGNLKTFSHEQCQFSYRDSIFKSRFKDKYLILSVNYRLSKSPHFNTSYGAIKQTLEEMKINKLSLKAVSDAVIHIRRSKLPDPAEIGNAGSFFKNPTIDQIDFEGLRAEFPGIQGYNQPDKTVKVPAGYLIEYCGWKGKTLGKIGVHKNQALVLVNYGGGSGQDLKQLALDIQKSVADTFGIILDREVTII